MRNFNEEVQLLENVNILDCTLRDGGYCNQWLFGKKNIIKIIDGLIEAGINIIECGFFTNNVQYNAEVAKYTTMEQVAEVLPQDHANKLFVCLINYGEYEADKIPEYDGTALDGFRIAFHKKDMVSALKFCQAVKEKGYKVFIQPMVSLNYTDEEFLELIRIVNGFEPFAFYIVDSFGVMKRKDLIRLFYMVEHNLRENIAIGYHSHNNMQLAYSNAQSLVDIRTKRKIIIDSSIFGMGRGAGNLNTELFVEYLNDNLNTKYILKPLLTIIDEILDPFYQKNYWGYSLPNYLAAKYNTHPNYAGYLDTKKTLTVENMDDIFSMIDEEKRSVYDKNYIENLYIQYMDTGNVQEEHLAELKTMIKGKEVLIIASGRSTIDEKEKVLACASRENIVTIGINFDYTEFSTDFIFLSNLRRFRELPEEKRKKCIVTSNIPASDAYVQTNYHDLLNHEDAVQDNAGMMLIKYLIQLDAVKIFVAGLDGYSVDAIRNYVDPQMSVYSGKERFTAMNQGMIHVLKEFKEQIEIEFVTTPKFVLI